MTNALDFSLYCTSGSHYPLRNRPEEGPSLTVTLADGNLVISGAPDLNGMTLDEFEENVRPAMHALQDAHSILTGAHALLVNHPTTLGMIYKETINYGGNTAGLSSIFGLRYGVNHNFISDYFQQNIPEVHADVSMLVTTEQDSSVGILGRRGGWFTPDADPESPGTPFLVPHYTRDTGVAWGLRRVCGRNIEDVAGADNVDGIKALVETCRWHSSDPEAAAALRTLEGDSNMEAEIRQLEQAKTLAAAREAFSRPKDRVKPRKTRDIILENVTHDIPRVGIWIEECSLMPPTFSIRSGPTSIPYLHAGLIVKIRSYVQDVIPQEVQDDIYKQIEEVVRPLECSVMKVAVTSGNAFLVTKRPDLIRKYASACGVVLVGEN